MRKKSDVLVLVLIAVVVFGGMHLVREKRLDNNPSRIIHIEPAGG